MIRGVMNHAPTIGERYLRRSVLNHAPTIGERYLIRNVMNHAPTACGNHLRVK